MLAGRKPFGGATGLKPHNPYNSFAAPSTGSGQALKGRSSTVILCRPCGRGRYALVRPSHGCAGYRDFANLLFTMRRISRPNVVGELQVTIIHPFDFDIVKVTRPGMAKNLDVPAGVGTCQFDLGIVAAKEASVVVQSCFLAAVRPDDTRLRWWIARRQGEAKHNCKESG